ncbi:MAG TPA: serine hydrolase [Actinocrinis sp.]|jgi:beta-lactamase class A
MGADSMISTLAISVPGLIASCADEVLPLASVGKLLLLAEVARQAAGGALDPDEPVEVRPEDRCAGSGLLVDLAPQRWTVADLALLAASVSDNTATNALLRRIGLDRVNQGANELGLRETRLLDRIREPRLPQHAPTFAVGTARELAALAELIAGPEPWARTVLGWLAASTDRAMVAAGIPHDPERRDVPEPAAPGRPARAAGLWVANKTGTDAGIRADVGVVRGVRQVCYAVLGSGPPGGEFDLLRAMRAVGVLVSRFAS